MYSKTIEQVLYSLSPEQRLKLVKKKKLLINKIKASNKIQKTNWKIHAKNAANKGEIRGKKYGPLVGTIAGGVLGATHPVSITHPVASVNAGDYKYYSDFSRAVINAKEANSARSLVDKFPLASAGLGAVVGGTIGKYAGGTIGRGIGYVYGSTRNKRNKLMNKFRQRRISRINKKLQK